MKTMLVQGKYPVIALMIITLMSGCAPSKGLTLNDAWHVPVPEPPQPASLIQRTALYGGAFNAMLAPRPVADLININSVYNRTSACYLSDKSPKIVFWADKILHKHDVMIDKDIFYLMAKPSAPEGIHSLDIDIFCSEFDDWSTGKLEISVIKP